MQADGQPCPRSIAVKCVACPIEASAVFAAEHPWAFGREGEGNRATASFIALWSRAGGTSANEKGRPSPNDIMIDRSLPAMRPRDRTLQTLVSRPLLLTRRVLPSETGALAIFGNDE